MTEPESPDSIPDSKALVSSPGAEATAEASVPEPEPETEPWTPERVLEWNAYYDLYVALGVALLAFVVSAHMITHTSIWTQLQAGRIIAARGAPVVTDVFSYTEEGRRWINIPWLFEWSHALLHEAATDLAPAIANDPAATSARAEQIGAGVLVALNALVRVATVLLLLSIRHRGPGLWWSSLCALVALGAVYSPLGWIYGGIARPAEVAPETWGQLLLALELLLLFRTIDQGRRGAIFGLIPLFLLWANLDESFLAGLIVLAMVVVGRLARGRDAAAEPLSFPRGLAVLGSCAAVCLANPSFYRIYPAALSSILALVQSPGDRLPFNQLSFFGMAIRGVEGSGNLAMLLVTYYSLIVGLGLGSFLLNRRHFSLSRFLAYAATAVLWGAWIRFGDVFALVFAATVALNGQEWYHDRFGTGGRLGRGWTLWSIGGRAVTIVLIFFLVAKFLLGWKQSFEVRFGFGFNPDDFAFEAADSLRAARLQGRVLNTSLAQGDALIWRAYPDLKTYIDSRPHLFPPELLEELRRIRLALSEDDVATWRPLLDRYQISAILIEEPTSPKTYRRLMQSPHWIPFHDDGNVIMFGRADAGAPAADVAYFRANRLDPEAMAYHQSKPVPASGVPPTPVTWLDQFFQQRSLSRSQPHTAAARRRYEGPNPDPESPMLPDPARCLLTIREARIALARQPDDTQAYRILSQAYGALMIQEAALLAGIPPTPENRDRILRVAPRPDLLMTRFRQRATALNYAIQTTAPPRTEPERQALRALDQELYRLYLSVNFIDLARDRLKAWLATLQHDDSPQVRELRGQLMSERAELDDRIAKVQEEMDALTEERQAGPLQRANLALARGMPGLAIQEFEEALQTGVSPAQVKPQLLDLYCDSGQPEKALDLLSIGNVNDPSLGPEPGLSALRQGRVYFLLGNYEYAATLWQKNAIPQIRFDRTIKALTSTRSYLRGEIQPATSKLLSVPGTLGTQASWDYELGLCRLEAGTPDLASEPLIEALRLAPKLPTRPIIAYYLEKLGKPVPPAPADEANPEPEEQTGG